MKLKKQAIVDYLETARNTVNDLGNGCYKFQIGLFNVTKYFKAN
jgi:hypothetical protein